MPELNLVSECCHRPILNVQQVEFPLGGSRWSQTFVAKICECCGRDTSPVEECGICGVVGCKNECELTRREQEHEPALVSPAKTDE